jgi:hypothetical protein
MIMRTNDVQRKVTIRKTFYGALLLSTGFSTLNVLPATAQATAVRNQIGQNYAEIDVSQVGGVGVEYGMAYDTRRHVFTGKKCVTNTQDDVITGSNSGVNNQKLRLSKSMTDLAKELDMGVTASARYGTRNFKAESNFKYKLMQSSKTSRFASSLLAVARRPGPIKYLNLDSLDVGLSDYYVDMFSAPGRKGEFRRDCGDAYVYAMQYGHRFYGLATITETSRDFAQGRAINFDAEVQSGTASASVDIENTNQYRDLAKNSNLSIDVYQNGTNKGVTTLDELAIAYKHFNETPTLTGEGMKLKIIVEGYDTLGNFPNRDPLRIETNDDKLGYLNDALWDLQSMLNEVTIYLDRDSIGDWDDPTRYPIFSYGGKNGVPGIKLLSVLRPRQVQKRWQDEIRALRTFTLSCIDDFTPLCDQGAMLYRRSIEGNGSRILTWDRELLQMPEPYAAICRDLNIPITGDKLSKYFRIESVKKNPASGRAGWGAGTEPIVLMTELIDADPFHEGIQGDKKTGGKPMKIRGWLNFVVDTASNELKAYLGVHYSETEISDRNKMTEFVGSTSATIFPTHPLQGGGTDTVKQENDDGTISTLGVPKTCRIDRVSPVKPGAKITLTANEPPRSRAKGQRPPGAPFGYYKNASLSDDIYVTARSYGYVEKITGENQYTAVNIPRLRGDKPRRHYGLLESLRCIPDTRADNDLFGIKKKGQINKGVRCTSLDMQSAKINFYPMEDDNVKLDKFPKLNPIKIFDLLEQQEAPKKNLERSIAIGQAIGIGFIPIFGGDGTTSPAPAPAPNPATPTPTEPIAISLPSEAPAEKPSAPPSGELSLCAASIQGKIAWNYGGNKGWNVNNLDNLCAGAENSVEPGICFQTILHSNTDNGAGSTQWSWRQATKLCKGTQNASQTVSCYTAKIRSVGGAQAIAQCTTR